MRNRFAMPLSIVLAAAAFTTMAAPPAYVPLEQRLTAEQMRNTGLDGLSEAQLRELNAILAADARPAPAAPAKREATRAPVEARLVGRFTGWRTGTVFTLDDGSRWQVSEGSFDARPVEAPRVTIKPGLLSGWYMHVEGQPVVASVRRAR
ncbi:hypothetical protein GCM10008101_01010 [Lysobacter xinjiangensis]|uniref:Secreted protein n=1 Tax=Cognatilysobacter xinjiangensis TaxID=546892 RepID=A0ABQ3BR81_9GAMM|nr:hypothetical protein [Lysobacter xinjiangensis]GGZ51783.1 hypothetical protein GCM10008101_01010 [Lysobacter xinjiangensis]